MRECISCSNKSFGAFDCHSEQWSDLSVYIMDLIFMISLLFVPVFSRVSTYSFERFDVLNEAR